MLRQGIAEGDVLYVQIRRVGKESRRSCVGILVSVYETRNIRVRVLRSPCIGQVTVVVESRAGSHRRVHEVCISRVVYETAYLVGERYGEIHSVEVQRRSETTVEVWGRISLELLAVGRSLAVGGGCHALVLVVVGVPHRLSVVANTSICRHVEGVERKSLSVEVGTADITPLAVDLVLLVVVRQTYELVTVVRHVEVEAPQYVLRTDEVRSQVYFDTAVVHVADVGPYRGVSERRWNRKLEEHVRRGAVEEVDATGQAVAPESELYADVEVGVGLPRDILVTLAGEYRGDIAVTVVSSYPL